MNNLQLTERDVITSIINNYYILDYGFVTAVKNNTVDVTHATILKTNQGNEIKQTVTQNIELLTVATGGLAIDFDVQEGDKVLLLGLKTYIPKVEEVTQAKPQTAPIHYSRETLKALPLCVFNDNAQVKIAATEGTLKINVAEKIELNGNDKNFVTWAELNSALSTFLTQLTTALTTTPIVGNGSAQTWTGLPTSIDISAAKTTTIVTGG